MTNDTPDTFLGALIQMIVGLAMMAGSLILFLILMGIASNMLFGTAPSLLEPFGGVLTGFLTAFLELLVNLFMIAFMIVMVWLITTGQVDDVFDDQQSSNSRQHDGKSRRVTNQGEVNQLQGSNNYRSSSDSNNNSTNTTGSTDGTEFDDYGQISRKQR